MAKNIELAEAFMIFARYGGKQDLSAEHDVIYAGPDPSKVVREDVERLDKLGWAVEEEFGCFRMFT